MKEFLNALEAWDISVGTTLAGILLIILIFRLFLWLFGAYGIYRISEREQLKKPWISFILPIYPFALGRIAEKYIKKDGTKSAKFSVWLLVLSVGSMVLGIAFFISAVISFTAITQFALKAIELDSAMTIEMFGSAIYAISFYFVALTVYLVYSVTNYVALWRIFATYSYKNATLFLILTVFTGGLIAPILIFAIRNNQQQIHFFFNEYE